MCLVQVLDCVGQSVQMFDEVNVATALHRLAKLQPPSHGSHPSPIIYADQFQQLVGAVGRLLPQFEAQAVSNTMWGEPPGYRSLSSTLLAASVLL